MLHSWQGVLLYKGVTPSLPSLVVAKKLILVLSVQSTLFQKASGFSMFSFAYFRRLILCSDHMKGFFLATLPCRSLLFKVRCIVDLWTARPVFALHFLQLFCSDVWVLLSISHQVSGHSIWNLSWSSRPCLDFNCSIYLPFSNNVWQWE